MQSSDYFPVKLRIGSVKKLLSHESEAVKLNRRRPYKDYHYYTVGEFMCTLRNGKIITIPEGYLINGREIGWAWVFHEYLYSSHMFDDSSRCTRKEADFILLEMLRNERLYFYSSLVRFVLTIDLFYGYFEKEWFEGGFKGPEYISDICTNSEGSSTLESI